MAAASSWVRLETEPNHNVLEVGMGTEIDTFTGTDRMTSVVPGISSHKNARYLFSIPLERTLAGRDRYS